MEMQDMRNSIGLSHCCLSGSSPTSSFFPVSLMKLLSLKSGTLVCRVSSPSTMSPTLLGFFTILLPLLLTKLLLL